MPTYRAPVQDMQFVITTGADRQFVENGWNGLNADPEYGGQGLPGVIAAAAVEMWNSANMSFALALC
jgi:alkylation response protein AidB-like acyl-CoA dehydrogenase